MSYKRKSVKVLKAVSSPVRMKILTLLLEKNSLSYTELMESLRMNPSRDAGRFAYHLKLLLKADLIETDAETKKYGLTELGAAIIKVMDEIERKALKPKRLLVRTSRFTIEEFDANRIAESLIKEASMPPSLAQKIAKEAKKRLLKAKTKYLTAPLVREVVNAVLIEKGLEEYRHKLTRLGLPVHDIPMLLKKIKGGAASVLKIAGEKVFEEYTLLKVFPRDIADAHLSGSIHINGLGMWILKPDEVMHDLRFFFKNGLNLELTGLTRRFPPPKSFDSALSTVLNVVHQSAKEVNHGQTLDYFNIFLAPFIQNLTPRQLLRKLRLFIRNLSQHETPISLGLELTVPKFLTEEKIEYQNFFSEAKLAAELTIEAFKEESSAEPILNPKLIIKIRPGNFKDEEAERIILKAYALAIENGAPYFAALNNKQSVFSASGVKLEANFKGDWEIDTLRTGSLGEVTVNLPRIAYESKGKEEKFFGMLGENLEMAARALEIKYRAIRRNCNSLLPFLMQKINGEHYFRLENSLRIISFVGLRESAEIFYGKNNENLNFVEKIAHYISNYMRKRRIRLLPAILPNFDSSERLALLDIEKYGVAKVKFHGTREKPFYSTVNIINLKEKQIPQENLDFKEKIQELHVGGDLTVMDLGTTEYSPEELAALTKQLISKGKVGLFTFNRNLTYCLNCKKSHVGLIHKCPSCGATSSLIQLKKIPYLS